VRKRKLPNIAFAQEQTDREEILCGKLAAAGRITLLRVFLVDQASKPCVCAPKRFCFEFLGEAFLFHFKIKIGVAANVFSRVFWHSPHLESSFVQNLNQRIFNQAAENFC